MSGPAAIIALVISIFLLVLVILVLIFWLVGWFNVQELKIITPSAVNITASTTGIVNVNITEEIGNSVIVVSGVSSNTTPLVVSVNPNSSEFNRKGSVFSIVNNIVSTGGGALTLTIGSGVTVSNLNGSGILGWGTGSGTSLGKTASFVFTDTNKCLYTGTTIGQPVTGQTPNY